MTTRRGGTIALAALAVAAGWLGGCKPPCPETFVGIDTLVSEYNANADGVGRLWARAKIAATLADEKGRTITWGSTSPLATPNGLLLYGRGDQPTGPHNFVLIGRETAAVELFRVGSNVDEGVYYFWYRFGDQSGAWYGLNRFAGGPGIAAIPIDPHQLLAMLAIAPLPADQTDLPTVAVRMNRTPGECAYRLTYVDRQPVTNRVLFRREMYFRWSDDAPRRPYRVDIFDNQGRRVVTASLADYEPVAGSASETPPMMPTDITMEWESWPGRVGAVRKIRLVLSEMTTAPRGNPAVASKLGDRRDAAVQVDAHLQEKGDSR